ncbi:metal-dependent amidase/aminoacylase/carboxypeptidase [Massarina eburnea CBS 473.64]|uniref:Metal-dependent amidase/aminoacylase/carboxypeptidase n=1 Tax=Massarina eburnea CBS 473.64 TaxID=1395130 RepID=A0A6A6S3L1_9PLEO|nr:metal-dependent amidase/aminoacylase/carboxypeptidase [Massarina eburnea CBS 473.64]
MPSISEIIAAHQPEFAPYEKLYKHFHAHPELSFQEEQTAARIVKELDKLQAYAIYPKIGGHGLAAVLQNGPGPTILLRADIDGLPVQESTNVPFASTLRMTDDDGIEKPTMHACGHDIHITALLLAASTLANKQVRDHWSGTLILVFQPAEERGAGAQAMVDDGLYEKVPLPDVVVGGHVVPFREGRIGTKRGLIASSADSFKLRIEGRQAHASTPHVAIDPVVQAASTIMRLQTIVSREIDPRDFGVVTVSSIKAGDAVNIIPQFADLKLNIRAGVDETRTKIIDSISRIVSAEAAASAAPAPSLDHLFGFPLLHNNDDLTASLERTFAEHFGENYDKEIPRANFSEDFGILATAIGRPSCFFLYGGLDCEKYDSLVNEGRQAELPGNHSSEFLPVVGSVKTGADAYTVSALTILGRERGNA